MPAPVSKNKLLVGNDYVAAVIDAIANAKDSIRVFMYDWRINKSDFASDTALITHALTMAQSRGVSVRAFVNSSKIAADLSAAKIDARVYAASSLMHAKVFVFDKNTIVIGSHNITENAFHYNIEISTLFNDPDVATTLHNYFDSLWLL